MSLFARKNIQTLAFVLRRSVRRYSETADREKPVKFSTSEAANWRAEFTRRGNIYDDSPDAQPFVVSISTAIFLFYFLYYREENDLDENINTGGVSLFDRVEGLEEVQLRLVRQDQLSKGASVVEIDKRLQELEKARLEKHSS